MPATFHFYLRTDQPDKNGECKIYLRITHNRKMKYVSTGIKVKPDKPNKPGSGNWNPDTKNERWVRKSHRNYAALNRELKTIKDNAEAARGELVRQKRVSSDSIRKLLEYNSKDNFFEIAEEYQQEIKEQSFYTWKQNKVAIEKVKKFHGSDHLPLNHIDRVFLTKLVNFMQSSPYNNKASTIHKNFGAIKAVLDRAVLHKPLPVNPMNDMAFKLPKKNGSTSKTKLTNKQIKAIEGLKLEPGSKEWHARNAFILSYYFCGIRVGDLCMLTWKNVKNDRLNYVMGKTGNEINVKIPNGAKPYLEAYRSKDSKESDYIFPFLSDLTPKERKNSEAVKSKISSWNAMINGKKSGDNLTGLKKVAELAEINEPVSMHVARHSFAQYAVEAKGVPTYRLMILLGHQNIKTTMQYLKTINVTVADDTIDAIF